MSEEPEPTRRPFTGSCHCGAVRYIVYLTLPLVPLPADYNRKKGRLQEVYRCNCSTCQKTNLLHIRLPSAADDFFLLSPLDPFNDLGDYRCFEQRLHFFFCKTCAVRCFTFAGEGELKERPVGESGEKKTVWSPKEGWVESRNSYLSVNGYSLDPEQEGLDLREWTEKKRIVYLDLLHENERKEEPNYERPCLGGAY